MTLRFVWHERKNQTNRRNHGVSFDEAKTVFLDPFALTKYDREHSDQEDRYIELGFSTSGRLLVVMYTERGDSIRIISSRLAERDERKSYEQRRG